MSVRAAEQPNNMMPRNMQQTCGQNPQLNVGQNGYVSAYSEMSPQLAFNIGSMDNTMGYADGRVGMHTEDACSLAQQEREAEAAKPINNPQSTQLMVSINASLKELSNSNGCTNKWTLSPAGLRNACEPTRKQPTQTNNTNKQHKQTTQHTPSVFFGWQFSRPNILALLGEPSSRDA